MFCQQKLKDAKVSHILVKKGHFCINNDIMEVFVMLLGIHSFVMTSSVFHAID